jgi:uncharacterized UBP type Zn finger protein
LDPATKRNVHIERPIFSKKLYQDSEELIFFLASTMDDSDSDEVHTDSMSLLDFQNSSNLSPNIGSPNFDISGLKNSIYSHIGKTSMEELLKVESLLQQALLDITGNIFEYLKKTISTKTGFTETSCCFTPKS